MKVLRIEHPESGKGCYTHFPFKGDEESFKLRDMIDRHGDSNTHPSPYFDKGLEYHPLGYEFCGFADIIQLCVWFTHDELILLFSLGFELIEVEAKNVRIGERQVVFEKETI